jgi:hypothetical protein
MIVLFVVGGVLAIGLLAFFCWLVVDRYWLRPNYYRVLIMLKSGGFSSAWARRTHDKTKDGKYNIAKVGVDSYYFTPEDMTRVFGYTGFAVYENNFKAVKIDFHKLEIDSKTTLHPNIITEILRTKLIAELLQGSRPIEFYLLVANLILTCLILIAVVYFGIKTGNILVSIQGNVTAPHIQPPVRLA